MKVELLKDECGRFEIAVKNHNKPITISTLAKDDVDLETDYLEHDSILLQLMDGRD
jgi:hypothetical protein